MVCRGHCWWSQGFIFVSYFGSAFQVITDWVSALVPALIIMNLNMRRRLKVSLVCVLSVGSLASIAVTVRMFYYKYFDVKAYPDNYLCKRAGGVLSPPPHNPPNVFAWLTVN